MSISKKFYGILLSILAVFALVGCTTNLPQSFSRTISEAEADLELVMENIFFTDADLNVTADLEFTTTTAWADRITIVWESSDTSVIGNDGKVTRPEYGQGNKEVTVKVTVSAEYTKLDDGTFKIGSVSASDEWTFVVMEAGRVYTIESIKNDLTMVPDETEVSFEGIIVGFSNYKGSHLPFVHDGTDGMYVFIDSPELKVGDKVKVNALYDVYYNLVQVSAGNVTVLESGCELPVVEKGSISDVVAAEGYFISETIGVAAGKLHNVDAKVVFEPYVADGKETYNVYLQDPFTGEEFIVHYETAFDYVPGHSGETYLDILKAYDGKYVNITVVNYDRKDGEERVCLTGYPIVEIEEPQLSDEDKATISINSLSVNESAIADFDLIAEVEHGTIAWEVVSGTGIELVDGVAKVSRTTVDQEAVIKATVTVGEVVLTKEFTIVIAGLVFEPISYEEAIELAGTTKDVYTSEKYYLEGVITEVYNATYGNMYITDGVNTFTVYGTYSADGSLRYDAMENAPKAGDRVIVFGILGYYTAPQMKNGWIVAQEPGTDIETVSNKKADELAVEAGEAYTTEKVTIKGVVTEIASATWGNIYVQDIYGISFYIYGLYSVDGTVRYDAMENAPQVGDFVVLTGIVGTYKGAGQMKNGWLVQLNEEVYVETEHKHVYVDGKCECGEVDPNYVAPKEITIEEAIKIGANQEHNTFTKEKYIITGVITEVYNTTYGNMYITDGVNKFTVYGSYSADGTLRYDALEVKPVAGDTITILSVLGSYNGTAQAKNAWIIAHTAAEQPEHKHEFVEGKCECGEVDPDYVAPEKDILVAEAAYQGSTVNMAEGKNNASLIGLNSLIFTVETDACGSYKNKIGLNQDGTIRLYADSATKDGNDLTIKVAKGYGISYIKVSLHKDSSATFAVLVDGKEVAEANGQFAVNGSVVVIRNNAEAGQVRMTKIEIGYYSDGTAEEHTHVYGENEKCECGQLNPEHKHAYNYGACVCGNVDKETVYVVKISEAIKYADGVKVTITATVKSVDSPWDAGYKNMCVTIEDETGTLYVFRTNTLVNAGDKIILTGTMATYSGSRQITSGSTAEILEAAPKPEHIHEECPVCTLCVAEECDGAENEKCAGHAPELEEGQVSATLNIADAAKSEGWTNQQKISSVNVDENITMSIAGGTNSGKYYTADGIRVYATDTPAGSITITAKEGYKIKSVSFKILTGEYAFLQLNGVTVENGQVVEVGASTATFQTVKNGSNGKQVRILGVTVVYEAE